MIISTFSTSSSRTFSVYSHMKHLYRKFLDTVHIFADHAELSLDVSMAVLCSRFDSMGYLTALAYGNIQNTNSNILSGICGP